MSHLSHYLVILFLVCSTVTEGNRIIDMSDYEILRKTIFLWTAGQPTKVEKAVAHVLRNRFRANREEFGGRNIADVCDQFWEHEIPENVVLPEEYELKMNKWLPKLWNGGVHDATKGALYFRLPDENGDDWTEGMTKTTTINKIDFFKD